MVRLSVFILLTVRLEICINSTQSHLGIHVDFVYFLYKYNVTNNMVISLVELRD